MLTPSSRKNYQSQLSNIPVDKPTANTKIHDDDIIVLRGETKDAKVYEVSIFREGNNQFGQINIKYSDPDFSKLNQIPTSDWNTYIRREDSQFYTPILNSILKFSIHKNPKKLKLSNTDNEALFNGYPKFKTKNNIKTLIIFNCLYLEMHDKAFSWKFNFNDTLKNVLSAMLIMDSLCNNKLLANGSLVQNNTCDSSEIKTALLYMQPIREIHEIIKTFPSLGALKNYKLSDKELMFLQNLYRAYILKDCSFLANEEHPKTYFISGSRYILDFFIY